MSTEPVLSPEVVALLADAALWAVPTPQLRDRVLRLARDPEDLEHVGPSLGAPLRSRRSLRPLHVRRVGIGLLAAAAVTALFALGPLVLRATNPGRSTPTAEVALVDPSGQARATATITQEAAGWRMHLDASLLPALPAGTYYEAFVSAGSARPLSAGTFRAGGVVTLWTGVEKVGGRQLAVQVVTPGLAAVPGPPVAAGAIPPPS